jgi:DNA-binding response OmpR family regulator
MTSPLTDPRPLVLVVEDEQDFHLLYRLALEPEGFEIVSAHDADEAMELINDRTPDVILADTVGAQGRGPDLLTRIHSNEALRRIPVIVCSGRSERQERDRAASLGAAAYFVKPVERDELVRTIRSLLGL